MTNAHTFGLLEPNFKKPVLKQLLVIDPDAMSDDGLMQLGSAYNRLDNQTLLAIAELAHDKVRAQIDDAILTAFGLTVDLQPTRELLAAEPIFQTNRAHDQAIEDAVEEEDDLENDNVESDE